MATRRLPPEELYQACALDALAFDTTEQLEPLGGMLGQDRALEAIDVGVNMADADFNLFVLGPPGVGKHRFLRAFLNEQAAGQPVPPDWCYVENFDDPQHPRVLQLPPGTGQRLRQDMRAFLEDLLLALPAAFQSEAYRTRQQEIEDEFNRRQEAAFHQLDEEAREQGIAILPTPSGYTLAPLRDGKLLEPEEYERLPKEEKARIEALIDTLREKLKELLRQVPVWQRELNQRLKALQREVTELTVNQLIGWLQERYAAIEAVRDYVASVRQDVIDNVGTLYAAVENVDRENVRKLVDEFVQYGVNVLVDNGGLRGAPVVYEDNPTYQNLIGRVEHVAEMGTLLTNFTLIRPGALHRANGGYLILDARKVLANLYAWDGLKRALSAGEIKIESLERIVGFVSTITLEPENIPLRVKVVLVGEPPLYYLLKALDPDFGLLFKIAADFAWDMPRDETAVTDYARFIATLQRRHDLPPVTRDGVARLIEHASRLAGDREKLSLYIDAMADLLREAALHARRAGSEHIARDHVQQAIDAARRRQDQYRERLQEMILRDIQHVETDGQRVAQVNGLSVIELGDYAFGPPLAHHRHRPPGRGQAHRHRARGALGRPHPLQGRAHPVLLPGQPLRPRAAPAAGRLAGVRAVLRQGGRRQRLGRRAVRPAVGHRRPAAGAALRRHRLHRPARPTAGHRRRQREDRGLLRAVPRAGPGRAPRGGHPRRQRAPPHAARGRGAGGGRGALPHPHRRARGGGHGPAVRAAGRRARRGRQLPRGQLQRSHPAARAPLAGPAPPLRQRAARQ